MLIKNYIDKERLMQQAITPKRSGEVPFAGLVPLNLNARASAVYAECPFFTVKVGYKQRRGIATAVLRLTDDNHYLLMTSASLLRYGKAQGVTVWDSSRQEVLLTTEPVMDTALGSGVAFLVVKTRGPIHVVPMPNHIRETFTGSQCLALNSVKAEDHNPFVVTLSEQLPEPDDAPYVLPEGIHPTVEPSIKPLAYFSASSFAYIGSPLFDQFEQLLGMVVHMEHASRNCVSGMLYFALPVSEINDAWVRVQADLVAQVPGAALEDE